MNQKSDKDKCGLFYTMCLEFSSHSDEGERTQCLKIKKAGTLEQRIREKDI